jgi:hypothetical protein
VITAPSGSAAGRTRRRLPATSSVILLGLGAVAAAGVGLASSYLEPVVIGLVALLPVFAHVRHVGLRRAITEPSPITFIVAFYVFVFPLRAAVVAASGYTDLVFERNAITGSELTDVLFLASAGTTMLVECYYLVAGRAGIAADPSILRSMMRPSPKQVIRLAELLTCLAVAGLAGVIVRYGGISGAQAALLSHTKGLLTSDTNLTDSAWQLFGGPAVWCASYIAADRATAIRTRLTFGGLGALIVSAMIVVYGSRLNAILALMGTWIMFYFSGGRVRVSLVLLIVPLFAALSVILLSSRAGGLATHTSTVERLSRVAGYGVLDVSLAVTQRPTTIRRELSSPNRWLDLPGYLVPSKLWPGRPDISAQRLDLFVARAIGNANDQNTGFPPTYLTEDWLLGGWPLVLALSAIGGAALGWVDRKLIKDVTSLTPGKLLAYCYIVTAAFSYYKDGDVLASFVGDLRTAIYLSLLLLITGVWSVRSAAGNTVRVNHWVASE